ncbi:ABC transporter ATP-binding protein [Anaerotignum lactatifermentans]|uniref:ABC transporter ATP-binding protein n=1 Tax=Anaerotignum lactatifermentans TaxID=160404 RepID=A0ABS2G8F6_9FIRM|nr:ABC transporter ATP-binding protein [Anaerotignum lactatifermentans]MBM6828827.1 ABC transporter ATP-binding protein [Anaerotignum lactatifermentans]MBM6877000.1 ABC transporter ATP-binding protein [Anaerotignum lactatifermentans]MBM6950558.1 ABC transporter ATP-binding protein [Anaerotignum lactatifermentans]
MIQLMKYLKEYRKDAVLTPILVILETMGELMLTVIIGRFIDELSNSATTMDTIWHYGVQLIIVAAICLIFGSVCGWESVKAASGLSKNLRIAMFDKIQDFSFTNIDRFSTNSLVTRMTTDVTNLQNAYMMTLRVAAKAPISILCALIMAFVINWKIALVYIVVILLLFVGLFTIARATHPIFQRVFRTYDKLNGVVRENLHGIRVVKGFVREDFENQKFETISGEIKKDFTKAEKLIAFNPFMMQTAIYVCLIFISWLSAKAIVGSASGVAVGGIYMTTGNFQNLITYSMMILMSLMMLSLIYVMMMMSRESVHRIKEVLAEESNLHNPEEAVSEIRDGEIIFENVGFSYADDPEKLCLSEINLQIRSGETIGIIGGTGSGKSSLIQLIPRLYDATVGKVSVGGRDVREYELEALRDAVAVVLQKNVLFSGTIKENLRWGNADATDEELLEVCRLAQADSFISTFPDGYDTYIEQGGTNVSGGQKQRLCIARALLKHPKVLILDDSTSAVDTKTDALIRRAFRSYLPETTKIIIAQRISSVEDADRIIVMDGGRIDAIGTHEELLKSNRIYQEVYESQQKGGGEDE